MPVSYRINKFATMAGVTVRALRHYDRLGLLEPTRSASGERLYPGADLERLAQIVALKYVGLPLWQIKQVSEKSYYECVPAGVEELLTEIESKLDLLRRRMTPGRLCGDGIRAGWEAPAAIGPSTTA
jgi:MerR family transcriptional regulator, thiopeptide resistance regulator